MKRLAFWLLVCFLGILPALALGENRALLIGCDRFVTQENTGSASANNVATMAKVLSGGALNLDEMVTRRNGVGSVDELADVIHTAFAGAQRGDVSYVYFSTHGLWEQGTPGGDFALVLSNGRTEETLDGWTLKALLDGVPGTKVLLVDACHSGALIGKGVREPFGNVFTGSDYVVVTSGGGAEDSWMWSGDNDTGGGYFTNALYYALSSIGSFCGDANRDGVVTLTELKLYLKNNLGASTARCYPEGSDFPIMTYDAAALSGRRHTAVLEGLSFETDLLEEAVPQVDFTFTMLRSARMAYQLVTQQDGQWDFANATLLWDETEGGALSVGTKERTLTLQREEADAMDWVLLVILTRDNGTMIPVASKLLCIPPLSGDPELTVETAGSFCPELGQEMPLLLNHTMPCQISCWVVTEAGEVVCRLASRLATRPENMVPGGTSLYWNGRQSDGTPAEAGWYRVKATAWVGDTAYNTLSAPFELTVPLG